MKMLRSRSAVCMGNALVSHPDDESLERFLLNDLQPEEFAAVEMHILSCNSCVVRLEDIETDIVAMKFALAPLQAERSARQEFTLRGSWRRWLEIPNFALAACAGVLALGLTVVPQLMNHSAPGPEITLSANRGSETPVVPQRRRLHLHLNASDLPEGTVIVQLVDRTGSEIWNGTAQIRHDEADVSLPSLPQPGAHFLRLYGSAQHDLLREFAVQVR